MPGAVYSKGSKCLAIDWMCIDFMKLLKRNGLGLLAAGIGVLMAVAPAAATVAVAPDSGPIAGGTSVTLPGLPDATAAVASVAAGDLHSLAVVSGGSTYAWGSNSAGQLGIGTVEDAEVPTRVDAPKGVTFTAVDANAEHSLALGSDRNAYAWGRGAAGQLGNGATENALAPALVNVPDGVTFTAVAAGYSHSLAIGSDGNVYAWGRDNYGQLGNGASGDALTPELVEAPDGVTFTAIAAGYYHSLAVGSDGHVYAWGSNFSGQLGNGATEDALVPTPVDTPEGVTFSTVAAGSYHSLALGSDGNTYAWGQNKYGQLGNGTQTGSNVPTRVHAPQGVAFSVVSAGENHVLAIGSDGNLYAWGGNTFGQFGNGSTASTSVPAKVDTPEGVVVAGVAAGWGHSVLVGSHGDAYASGWNAMGQLGNGGDASSAVPLAVTLPKGTAELSNVLFNDVPAPDAVVNEDGTITATAPRSEVCGPVNVAVEWTANGVAQSPVVFEGGFTYTGAYLLTAPENQMVKGGADATFTTAWKVCDGGAPSWEVSLDGGTKWVQASGMSGVTISEDGLTLTVTASSESHGALVRAVGLDSEGLAVKSDSATLTIAPSTVTFDPTDGSGVEAVQVPYGETVSAPKDPAREGHTFAGWYVDAAAGTKWDFAEPVVGDLALYAGWEKLSEAPSEVPPVSGTEGKTDRDSAYPAATTNATLPTTGGSAGWGLAGIGILAVGAGALLFTLRRNRVDAAKLSE